jgi:hypothetical protein
VAANDSNSATLSNIASSQLEDLLATVMAAVQAESTKQTAAVQTEVAKLTEPKGPLKKNYILATSLTERFDAASIKLRGELNVKLQHEIQSVSDRHAEDRR